MNEREPFSFLTEERLRAFAVGIDAANKYHDAVLSNKAHVYEQMPRLGRAFHTRYWLVGHVCDAFSGDEDAIHREINNIPGIEIDGHFIYFKKIQEPESPPGESKTLRDARIKQQRFFEAPPEENQWLQMPLPGLPPSEEVERGTPLCNLQPILAGYICDNSGRITALFFLDVDYYWEKGEVRNYLELDLALSSTRAQREMTQLPKTKFAVKSDRTDVRKENTAR